ncbi:MAG: radical SAM protein [Christensenellaceae bacterium]
MNAIFDKINHHIPLDKDDAIALLSIDNHSSAFYKLAAKANELSRCEYQNKAYVFAQIGLNASHCSGNCKFCSLAKDNFLVGIEMQKSLDEILTQVKQIAQEQIAALFLMTTADYSFEQFIKIGAAVKNILPKKILLVANIGDFDLHQAKILKQAGFDAAYHIVRLREGIDTDISVQTRLNTLDAIKDSGLDLYYCIEPIGKEHTYDEIADEMLRAREYDVNVMAVMRRVGVTGTKFSKSEDITELELTKIAAVTRLVTRPKKSMNVHEPMNMPLLAGVNQLYAEIGVNPRDNSISTEKGRGFDFYTVKKMLYEAEYTL